MVAVRIDISKIAGIQEALKKLTDPEYMLRPICFDIVDLMKSRIHQNGTAADGSQIGTYNNRYLALREKRFNRTSDKTIVVSLTRQLENDWAVVPTLKGYGIDFNNSINHQKARWVEENKGKDIFSLSQSESKYVEDRFSELVTEAFKNES